MPVGTGRTGTCFCVQDGSGPVPYLKRFLNWERGMGVQVNEPSRGNLAFRMDFNGARDDVGVCFSVVPPVIPILRTESNTVSGSITRALAMTSSLGNLLCVFLFPGFAADQGC